jgi:Tfp pilus assembly protein PilO
MKFRWTAIVAVACVLGSVALGVLAVSQYRLGVEKRGELTRLEATLAKLQAESAGYHRAADEVAALRTELKRFAEQVPYQPDLGQLLSEVGRQLAGGGAVDREILTFPTVNGTPLNRVPVSLRFKGSTSGTMALLRQIENYNRLTRIDRIVLEKADPASAGPISASVEFSLFSRASQEGLSWTSVE